jgi:hypothetical protein
VNGVAVGREKWRRVSHLHNFLDATNKNHLLALISLACVNPDCELYDQAGKGLTKKATEWAQNLQAENNFRLAE